MIQSDTTGSTPAGLPGGELLGRYTVRERLTEGGMSVVFRGHDERLRRRVCIKVFRPLRRENVLYRIAYEHFMQEVFTLSQLLHPHTLRIYDFGYLEGEAGPPFYVCEYMDGGTLRQLVQARGALSAKEMLEVVEPLLGALSEAHARGIVHRDIKPSNILFGYVGSRRIAKLADFGIAKATLAHGLPAAHRASDTPAIGSRPVTLYSPGWAAPEQVHGAAVDASTDVYGVGLLVAFALTGQRLLSDRDLDPASTEIDADAHMTELLDGCRVDAALKEVLARALRYRQAERWPTVEALLSALKGAVPDAQDVTQRFVPTSVEVPIDDLCREASMPDRQVQLLATDGHIDVTLSPTAAVPLHARLTLLPCRAGRVGLHVRGLNCFVERPGGRATSGVDLADDTDVVLLSADRRHRARLRCRFGRGATFEPGADDRTLLSAAATPTGSVLLDLGPDQALALLYRRPPHSARGEA